MGPTWGATWRYWKQSPHQAVQRALRRSAQQRNSNEYWNDLQTGAVSQNEFEAIIAANPNALTDYNIWMTEVIKYREGDANLGAVDPGYSIESGTVSSSTIDALIR